ncbi:sugar 3,4-ketoisomerase [Bacteroides pyogenes]|uniref:sugar 3,4-ketoisomerase n=1 Tax=Bacteroides pyogenes TaxID=310300 RepID=UPI001F283C75|nr:FdtA/QdtA family cupin domain-containing protein [Bacteroides pyogenes]MCE9107063.1 FdtA/QdtA family cupin domain-containing protein [Bacteroides pyogenes]
MSIDDVKLIKLPKFADPRGNLSFAEQNNHIPFTIQRTYWIYDVPGGESRGGHAFKETNEFIISISGCFDVTVDDGTNKKTFHLDRSYYGLFIPKGLWRTMDNFSTNSLALEFADTKYDRSDYVMGYEDYVKMRKNGEI